MEKHKKTVAGAQTPNERDRFKADLYCFLTEQMKVALDKIFQHVANGGPKLHNDLAEQRALIKEEKLR